MVDLRIKVDVKAAVSQIKDIAREQLPFVTALALTRTAQKAQRAIREALPQRFIIRRKAWVLGGVRIEAALKGGRTAAVKHIDAYMNLQEFGGTRFAFGKHLAIPLAGARPSPRSVIRAANKPKALMESGRGALVRFSQNGPDFIVMRKGRGKHFTLMYMLIPRAQIPARYRFAETVQNIARTAFESTFAEAWEETQRRWAPH